jgi:3-oxoacyl-ACP reductase-like protein
MRPLGRPRCRWEENIKMNLGETGCVDVNWTHLAHDSVQRLALVNTK